MKNADLHTHSIYSDGRLSPKQVVALAKKNRVKYLALSDHNSTAGIDIAMKECKKAEITLIPAVEISAEEDDLLGYHIDYKDKDFQKELQKLRRHYFTAMNKIVNNLQKTGIKITYAALLKKYAPSTNIQKSHVTRFLSELLNMEYSAVKKQYLSRNSEYYVHVKKVSIIKAIKIIRDAKGTPVLAHPWVEPESRALLIEKNFKKLVRAGLKGIEIDNGDRDDRRTLRILARIKQLAKRYGLIITSGSDFHGSYLTKQSKKHGLGKSNCDEAIARKLLAHY